MHCHIKDLKKLQFVQNSAARRPAHKNPTSHQSSVTLNKSNFKILITTYRALNSSNATNQSCSLRSGKADLDIPETKKRNRGDRAFSVAAPMELTHTHSRLTSKLAHI